jgi:hypothetical protein
MNYTKPEVSTLGDAKTAIEYIGTMKPTPKVNDPDLVHPTATAAYDLDE